jgi:sugar phosphate isomerase/epimerase
MKIGLAIAPENASPLAFVVFRDRLDVSIEKAARLGYDGVELALLHAGEVDLSLLRNALDGSGLELPVISSGRVFGEGRLWCTHPDGAVRRRAVDRIKSLVELAAQFGAKVNLGRVRGFIHEGEPREVAQARFLECLHECADHAAARGVELLLEPVNRYEINYINSVVEALELLRELGRPNVKVMPDLFHMNIEDDSIAGSLAQARGAIGYVHLADSNRRAPGKGHLNLPEILSVLAAIGYDWYVTAEVLPHPSPDLAAASAIRYLRQILPADCS